MPKKRTLHCKKRYFATKLIFHYHKKLTLSGRATWVPHSTTIAGKRHYQAGG